MSGQTVFVSRLVRLPLLDSESSAIGKIDDVVLALSGEESPRSVAMTLVIWVGTGMREETGWMNDCFSTVSRPPEPAA